MSANIKRQEFFYSDYTSDIKGVYCDPLFSESFGVLK